MWTELLNVLKALKYSPYVMTCILLRHILTAARLQVWFSQQPVALAWMGKSSSRRQLRHRLSPSCYKFSSVCIEGVLFPLTACEYLQVNVAACCSSLNEWVNEWDMRIINTVNYGQKLQLLGCTIQKSMPAFKMEILNYANKLFILGIKSFSSSQAKSGSPGVIGQWCLYNSTTKGFNTR